MAKKSQAELANTINQLKQQIKIGEIYVHFKSDTMRYRVEDLAVDTANDSICVVYRALYGEQVLFTRPVSEWSEVVVRDGRQYQRFRPVDG